MTSKLTKLTKLTPLPTKEDLQKQADQHKATLQKQEADKEYATNEVNFYLDKFRQTLTKENDGEDGEDEIDILNEGLYAEFPDEEVADEVAEDDWEEGQWIEQDGKLFYQGEDGQWHLAEEDKKIKTPQDKAANLAKAQAYIDSQKAKALENLASQQSNWDGDEDGGDWWGENWTWGNWAWGDKEPSVPAQKQGHKPTPYWDAKEQCWMEPVFEPVVAGAQTKAGGIKPSAKATEKNETVTVEIEKKDDKKEEEKKKEESDETDKKRLKPVTEEEPEARSKKAKREAEEAKCLEGASDEEYDEMRECMSDGEDEATSDRCQDRDSVSSDIRVTFASKSHKLALIGELAHRVPPIVSRDHKIRCPVQQCGCEWFSTEPGSKYEEHYVITHILQDEDREMTPDTSAPTNGKCRFVQVLAECDMCCGKKVGLYEWNEEYHFRRLCCQCHSLHVKECNLGI